MFSSGPNYSKLKTNLRLSINRLKLLEKKKSELAQKARKEIADFISAGKLERAKIRVEHIIREDYLVEAMEVTEMYCDLLLARFGLIQQMKDLDEGLAEAISSLIWVAPRLQTDVAELKIIADHLSLKYGKPYAQACREQQVDTISEKLIHKLSVQAPPKLLVEKYLMEIARNYNVEYEPDPQIMRESEWGEDPLISLDESKNNFSGGATCGGGSGGIGMNIPPTGFDTYGQNMAGGKPFDYPEIPGSSLTPGASIGPFCPMRELPLSYVPAIFLTNPQSLVNCFEEFKNKINEHSPDVVAVSETWFSDSHPAQNHQLEQYSLFHDDREERKGGGVALYVKKALLPYSPTIKVHPELECIWAGIGLHLFICCLYHPPRSQMGKLLMDHLVNTILDLRKSVKNAKVIIIGDFNDLPHERLYSSLGMQNLVLEPTHQNSVIDLILTDVPQSYAKAQLLPPIGNSRHHCVLIKPEKTGLHDAMNLPNVPDLPGYNQPGPPPPDMSADTMPNNDKSNIKENNQPKPSPRSKFDASPTDFTLPDLPSVPDDTKQNTPSPSNNADDIDFEDLNRRFEQLKKRK